MSILKARCMDYDDVAWAKCDELFEPCRRTLFEPDVLREIGRFIDKHHGGVPDELFSPRRGSFNLWFRLRFKDGGAAVIRFPIPGTSMFPEEIVQREVAVMKFLEYFDSFRAPHVLHHGMTAERPIGLARLLSWNPNVSQERLEMVYSQIVDVMLQVSRHKFSHIGCIPKTYEDDEFDDTWVVKHRPLTFNMNELVQLGGVDPAQLPQNVFETASSYYQALAEMHMTHLASQRHDAVESAEDCKQKYIARCLFRKITREPKLWDNDSGPFTLFCDDLRPGNVLVNENYEMTGVLVEELLKQGADLSVKAVLGSTPLREACLSGNVAVARILLENGADPDAETELMGSSGSRDPAMPMRDDPRFVDWLAERGRQVAESDTADGKRTLNAVVEKIAPNPSMAMLTSVALEHAINNRNGQASALRAANARGFEALTNLLRSINKTTR
ncbi:hypothetical protein BJX66DRAFT_334354 [Aspergillus keveii]|uniref:Ankyrin repeat-containing protein n=1 Tax=Aspergillus keveii TaxID=714993 RepID=A0ABR4GHA3_9EURO